MQICRNVMLKMVLKMVLSSFLLIIYLHGVNSNIFISGISSSSTSLAKCASVCEKTFPLTSNKIARSECCSRGCRFFGITELVGLSKQLELNISRDGCHNCCLESYSDSSDKGACNMGCDTMAKHHQEVFGLAAAEVSWSFFIEDGDESQILQAGELLEPDDVLTDPALKRQLVLDLIEDNKLPEMRVKTLPVNNQGNEMVRGEWWSDCSVRRVGVPRCLAASLLVLLILIALWFGLSCDEKSALPSPPLLFDPDQAPPLLPKYSLLDDVKV